MIEYDSFRIKNGKTFREVEIPLKDLGIVAIQGKNGVGKSSVWDLLQVMHFGKTPNGHKKDELIRNKKEAEWEIEFYKEGKHYRINYSRKKHGTEKTVKWKHHIYEDGVDITSHNQQTEVPKQLLKIIDRTQDEFNGSVHLTQNGQHILINGKPAQRKDYISNFFGLDARYDHVMEHAKKELQKTKKEIDRISAFDHSKATLEEEIKDIKVPDLESIKQQLEEPQNKIQLLNQQITQLNGEFIQIKNFEVYSPLAHSISNPNEELSKLQEEAGKINNQLEQQTLVSSYNHKARQNNQRIEELKHQLNSLVTSLTGDVNELTNEKFNLQTKKSQEAQLKPLRDELSQLPEVALIDTSDADSSISTLQVLVSKGQDKLTAIENGECPTCGHQHTTNDIEEIKQELANNKDLLQQWTAFKQDAVKGNEVYSRREYLLGRLQNFVAFSTEDEARLSVLDKELPVLSQKSQVERDLSTMNYQELMVEHDVDSLRVSLLENQQRQAQVQQVVEALSKCPEKPTRTKEEVTKLLTETMDQLGEMESIVEGLKSEIAVAEEKKYRRDRLQTQIDGLKKELAQLEGLKKDEFLYSSLVEAYGPKGLRLIQLNKIMDLLMERLPFFVNMLFLDKKMEFYHKCDAGNISIMWKRKDEEGEYDVDVSLMSGGEAKRLAVALVLALASCVPSKKRANILILDEIDGQLDSEGKYLFANELLPALKQDYKSVFIISHNESVQQADVYDQVWYFTKPERSHYTLVDKRIV